LLEFTQDAVISMPVLSMHEANWDDSRELSNGQEMQALRQSMGGVRSQDDARVGYMFQRPQSQTGKVGQSPYASKAWLGRERTALEQVSDFLRTGCGTSSTFTADNMRDFIFFQ